MENIKYWTSSGPIFKNIKDIIFVLFENYYCYLNLIFFMLFVFFKIKTKTLVFLILIIFENVKYF